MTNAQIAGLQHCIELCLADRDECVSIVEHIDSGARQFGLLPEKWSII